METNSKNYEKAIYALEKTQLEIAKLDRKARFIFIATEVILIAVVICASTMLIIS